MLLVDEAYSKVKIFGRSPVEKNHPKIEEHLVDMFQLVNQKIVFTADVVFCCIGTTQAKSPNTELYKKIDYGIPVMSAKLCEENGIDTLVVVSAMGANPESKVFYNKIKGEMERDVLKENVKDIFIVRPSLIGGTRNEQRFGERVAQVGMKLFGFLIPKPYKIIQPETIAKAMILLTKKGYSEKIITSEKIKEIANA